MYFVSEHCISMRTYKYITNTHLALQYYIITDMKLSREYNPVIYTHLKFHIPLPTHPR